MWLYSIYKFQKDQKLIVDCVRFILIKEGSLQ